MRWQRFSSDRGNAIIEFVAFVAIVFVPTTWFATQMAIAWVSKAEAQAITTQLVRAVKISEPGYLELLALYKNKHQDLEVKVEKSGCCVLVSADVGGFRASARGLK